jgi:hypothetical protein
VGKIDAGECDAPTRFFLWPSEVDTFKARVLVILEARDISVKACAGLPADERQGWDLFVGSAKPFLQKRTPTFGSYGEWVTTCGYSRYLDAWDAKLKTYSCKIVGPEDVSSGGAQNILKWAATGAIAVAIAAVAITYAPTIKAFLPERKK